MSRTLMRRDRVMPDRPSNLVHPGAQLRWISVYEAVIPIEALSAVAEIREGRDGRSQVISRDSAAFDGVLKMFQNSSTLRGLVVFHVGDIATVTADSLLVEADAVLTHPVT